jgi:Calcineurin-like phosphoesterase
LAQEHLDILLTAGDFVGHRISGDPDYPTDGNKELLKQVISTTAGLVHSYFPSTLVVPTMGNNDYWFHDQAPFEKDKNEYLQFLYDQWFPGSLGSESIKSTFLYGGYYRLDFDSKLSILAMNTMYYNVDNDKSKQAKEGAD